MLYRKTTTSPMVDTFTLNQLIRYTYQECSPDERLLIEEIASEDWSLREEIVMLREAKRFIPQVLFSAKPSSLERIMNYIQKQV